MDGKINIYNWKESKLRQTIETSEPGFSGVKFSLLEPHCFYATSTKGDLLIIDVRSGNILKTYKGHAAPINDFVEVPHHKVVVTAGDDFVCNIYNL